MINAYGKAPRQGQPLRPKAQWCKDQWVREKELQVPYHVEVLDTLKLVPDANRMLRRAMLGASRVFWGQS